MPTRRGGFAFDEILPRLVAAYEVGRLVPFIGAGMSVPTCTGWNEFVRELEAEAGPGRGRRKRRKRAAPEEIIRRANHSVRRLKSVSHGRFVEALRRSLARGSSAVPRQTLALARLWWPLVLSTNYDNCFAAAFDRYHAPRKLEVVGRSSVDCQRVLHVLTAPARSVLWAMQGFLSDTPCRQSAADVRADLTLELVVGHDEYRRVTYRDLHFRRAFAEVFRSRSLLFLGSGIRESYLQELFGEVLEMYGPSARPHYALMPKGEVDAEFMLARFQIAVVEYDDHRDVPRMLHRIAAAVERTSRRPTAWTFGRPARRVVGDWASAPELEVVRGPLPDTVGDGECLAVSAGGPLGSYYVGGGIAPTLRARRIEVERSGGQLRVRPPRHLRPYLGVFARQRVVLVRARSEDDERGLEHIYQASQALFDFAAPRWRTVRMQLLATGGTQAIDRTTVEWRARTFPERYSFIQIVRAYGDWRRANREADFRLALHVIAPPVHMEIASGRLDVLELLTCPDVRFWAEVAADGEVVERRLFQEVPSTPLLRVVDRLHLPHRGWELEVVPAPNLLTLEEQELDVGRHVERARTLLDVGVVPGSLLRFTRTGTRRR
jgi:hypothetical protein